MKTNHYCGYRIIGLQLLGSLQKIMNRPLPKFVQGVPKQEDKSKVLKHIQKCNFWATTMIKLITRVCQNAVNHSFGVQILPILTKNDLFLHL